MKGIMKGIPALLAGILLYSSLLVAGCGYEPVFRNEEFPPLSGDVVVLGDTLEGLIAALEAARQGAAVLVFPGAPEEDRWIWSEGAASFEAEGDDSEQDDASDFKDALAAYGGGRGANFHYDLLAKHAPADLDWFTRETKGELSQEGLYRYRIENTSLPQVFQRLKNAALNEGVRFFPDATVESLIFSEDDDSVAGIIYSGPAGQRREAFAPAVIIAAGGYLGNEELMQQFAPKVTAASWRGNQTGAAMQLALSAGLDIVSENLFSFAPSVDKNGSPSKATWPLRTVLIIEEQIIPLDGKGREEVARELTKSSELTGYLLVAGGQLRSGEEPSWPRYEGVDSFMETHGLDFTLLRRWFVQPYNEFYGIAITAVAEYCLGGISINKNGEVLRDGEPVPGLYAAGEAAGGLHGKTLMPGAALTEAIVWGRLVGRGAARLSQ